jgi:predicted transcriptional regulator YdeE/DNA-binding transcriptional MerR regulator
MDAEGLQQQPKGKPMIKIGDFSKLAHVSIKTLHHYDEMGLLRPLHVDRYTAYRYYEIGQLSRLNRILALKDLGFSLEQVAQLLDENLSTAELRGMLRMKQMELAGLVEDERTRLARVEQRLLQLEREDNPLQAVVAVKPVPAQTVLLGNIVAAREELLPAARKSLHALLQAQLERLQLKPAGPWFALLNDLPYADSNLEVALAVSVNLHSGQPSGWQEAPVRVLELEAVAGMASIIHQDACATLPQTYASLFAWIQSNGYQSAGPCREIYLPEDGVGAAPLADLYTGTIELQCPLQKASIPPSIRPSTEPTEGTKETMEPKIVNRPAFKVIGFSYVGKNEHGEIGQMWDRFNQHAGEVKRTNEDEAFGLCFSTVEGGAQPGEFEYVSGLEVAGDKGLPAGMVYREVPAHKYAVFTHHGKLDTLGETYQYIYNTGLAQAGLQIHPDKFDMEVYDKDFTLNSDESKFYICVAVL